MCCSMGVLSIIFGKNAIKDFGNKMLCPLARLKQIRYGLKPRPEASWKTLIKHDGAEIVLRS